MPHTRGGLQKRKKTLVQREFEAGEILYRERQEYDFIAALSSFADDILGTPLTPEFPRAASFYAPIPAAILDEHVAKAARTGAAESELSAVSDAETEINVETELDDSDAETEDGGYTLCTGWCGRQMHHEDTDDSGACGRCQSELIHRLWKRNGVRPCLGYFDLTQDSDSDEEDQSGYQSPAPLRCPGCGKLYCRMRGQHHVVVTDLTV